MLALARDRSQTSGGRARKARRGPGLEHAVVAQIDFAGPHMLMVRRLVRRKHRRKAGVGGFKQGAPLVAAPRRKKRGEAPLLLGPGLAVLLLGERGIGGQAEPVAQFTIEFRLDRADRDMPAIGATIGIVPVRAVEQTSAKRLFFARRRRPPGMIRSSPAFGPPLRDCRGRVRCATLRRTPLSGLPDACGQSGACGLISSEKRVPWPIRVCMSILQPSSSAVR